MFIDNENRDEPLLKAPTPGQSFTDDPDNPKKWETPPEITDVDEALMTIVHPLVTVDEHLRQFLKMAEGGVPLEFMVTMATYTGFKEGKWNPDVMLLLQEPLMYYMIIICEQAQIEYNLDEDDMEKSIQDPSYRYSSDPEFAEEVEALEGQAKQSKSIDEELVSKVTPSLLSPSGGVSPMVEEEEELV